MEDDRGGFTADSGSAKIVDDFFIFDLATLAWTKSDPHPDQGTLPPGPTALMAAASSHSDFFMFGGLSDGKILKFSHSYQA
jgi:hypothetical protein